MDFGPDCCPTATYYEILWTAACLVGVGVMIRRNVIRIAQLLIRLRDTSAHPERVVAITNMRRALVLLFVFADFSIIGFNACTAFPGGDGSIGSSATVGGLGILSGMLALLAYVTLDEYDDVLLGRAVAVERKIKGTFRRRSTDA